MSSNKMRITTLFSLTLLVLLLPCSSFGFDGDAIAVVSVGHAHTRLRVLGESPKSLMERLVRTGKGGKADDIAHASLTYHQWTSLEHDFRWKEFFILDKKAGTIRVASYASEHFNKTKVLYSGLSSKVSGTAYDWVRRELYFADPSFQAIFRLSVGRMCGEVTTCMTSLAANHKLSKTRRRRNPMASLETVVGVGVTKPYGMVVDPIGGFLYWIGEGETWDIHVATLEGHTHKILARNLTRPAGMTLDYERNRLYWIERFNTQSSAVRWCRVDGEHSSCHPKDLTRVYDSQLNDIQFYRHSPHRVYLVMANEFNSLILYDEQTRQQRRQHWMGKAQAVNVICSSCRHRHASNGPSFKPHHPAHQGFVFSDVTTHGVLLLASEKSGVLMVERTFMMGHEPTTPYPFVRESGITTMAVDVPRRQLYFFKRSEKTIYKVTMPTQVNMSHDPRVTPFMKSWMDDVTAMAVDWSTGNVYWLDAGYRRMMMCDVRGRYPTVIHFYNITRPQDMVIHSEKRWLFWSDTSDPDPRIERSRLDGGHREVILNATDFYERPSALALDLQQDRLYWSDGPFLCRATLAGKLVEDCKPRDVMARPAIKAIDIMHDYVIWSDFNRGLRGADTDGEFPLSSPQRGSNWFTDNYYSDVIYLHSSRQPQVENTCKKHGLYPEDLIGPPNTAFKFNLQDAVEMHRMKLEARAAAASKATCTHVCIPTPTPQLPKCACSVGYWRRHLGDCVPGITRDYILVLADVPTGKLFRQFSLLPHYHVVPMVGDTRAFDVTLDEDAGKLFWLDKRRHRNMVLTSDLTGKDQSVVLAGAEFNMTSIKAAFGLLYILTSSGQVIVLCLTSGLFTYVITDKTMIVHSIFIDRQNRYLYLSASRKMASDLEHAVFDTDSTHGGVLMRSNMDGTHLKIHYRCRGKPLGLTVHKDDLYWIDAAHNEILTVPLTLQEEDDDYDVGNNSTSTTRKNRTTITTTEPGTSVLTLESGSLAADYKNVDASSNSYQTMDQHKRHTASESESERSNLAPPIIPNRVKPRVVIQLEGTSKPRDIVITPDGDIFFTDDTKQAPQHAHVTNTAPVEDAGLPYLNHIGGIAYYDVRNKMDQEVIQFNRLQCSGVAIPLPSNQNETSCLCNIHDVTLTSQRCHNKTNPIYTITARQEGLCFVHAVQNGNVEGADINNYVISGQEVTVTCTPGYNLTGTALSSRKRKCYRGTWNSDATCTKALTYLIHGTASRGYVIFTQSTSFFVPRDVTQVDVIAIGGGGGGYDPRDRDLFASRSRAGMGGVSKFGHYVKAHGGLGGTKTFGGRGGWSRSLFGGNGGNSSTCHGGGAAGETRRRGECHLGSTSCLFCGAGGAQSACAKCPGRCSGPGSRFQGAEAADRFGGGATGANGGWGGGGGGYSRKSVRVSPYERVEVKVGRRGFPSARHAADGVVVVAWGDVIENYVTSRSADRDLCRYLEFYKFFESRDRKACEEVCGKRLS